MTDLSLTPLTPRFGVEVHGIAVSDVTADHHYPQLRAAFDEHSALLFRGQQLGDAHHLAFARLFGPIEDRLADERGEDEAYEVPKVSNVGADGAVTSEDDLHTLHLKANMLWHCDSTFMPAPALANILVARVVTDTGGATELASTRAAWADMPEELKSRVRGRGIHHRYSQSRARISPELARLPMFHKWPDQHWNAVWPNPVNGREALYIASHAYAVDGYDETQSLALLDELTEFCTRPEYVYSHRWNVGDVMIWDQRAVLHRGTPWPYDQPRTLNSLCVSAGDHDGLAQMRMNA